MFGCGQEKVGKSGYPKNIPSGICAGGRDGAAPLIWRAGKFPVSAGDPKVWLPMLGSSPAWSDSLLQGFPGENSRGISWGRSSFPPLEIPKFCSQCLEKIPISRFFPGKILSQYPHPPLELPKFHLGLVVTTPGWSEFPFPGFFQGKDPSGICWERPTSSFWFCWNPHPCPGNVLGMPWEVSPYPCPGDVHGMPWEVSPYPCPGCSWNAMGGVSISMSWRCSWNAVGAVPVHGGRWDETILDLLSIPNHSMTLWRRDNPWAPQADPDEFGAILELLLRSSLGSQVGLECSLLGTPEGSFFPGNSRSPGADGSVFSAGWWWELRTNPTGTRGPETSTSARCRVRATGTAPSSTWVRHTPQTAQIIPKKRDTGKGFLPGKVEFPEKPLEPWECPRQGWSSLGWWKVALGGIEIP